jgi:hypothetical protein
MTVNEKNRQSWTCCHGTDGYVLEYMYPKKHLDEALTNYRMYGDGEMFEYIRHRTNSRAIYDTIMAHFKRSVRNHQVAKERFNPVRFLYQIGEDKYLFLRYKKKATTGEYLCRCGSILSYNSSVNDHQASNKCTWNSQMLLLHNRFINVLYGRPPLNDILKKNHKYRKGRTYRELYNYYHDLAFNPPPEPLSFGYNMLGS